MENLNKSLEALDAAADELLKKSSSKDDKDDIKPNDVAEDSDDGDNDNDTEEVEKCDSPDGDNVKKSDDSDDSDVQKSEEPDVEKSDDVDDSDDVSKSLEDTQEALADDFKSDPDIVKGIENSEFNAAVVATLVKSLGEIQYDMSQNKRSADSATATLAKSLQASLATNQKLMTDNEKLVRRINKLEKSLNMSMEKLMDAIDSISVEPAHTRKSLNSINVHDKDFQKSLGSNSIGGFESLSKSQVIGVLTNELYSGNTMVTANDVISYESGAPLSPELRALVVNKCKA